MTASKTSNSDLFWAIRGAGANFGIVTSATLQLQDQVNDGNVVLASYNFPGSANSSVFELYQSFDDNLPAELSLELALSYKGTTGTSQISLTYQYFGPLADVQPYLDKAATPFPTTSSISVMKQPALYDPLTNGKCAIGSPISGGTGCHDSDVGIGTGFEEYSAWVLLGEALHGMVVEDWLTHILLYLHLHHFVVQG